MKKGKVLWFDDSSGRGMIEDAKTKTIWIVHYSAIKSDTDWRTLKDGSEVRFKVFEDDFERYVTWVREI